MTDKEIAQRLGISVGTVITLWSKARAKLGINSRVCAVAVLAASIARISSRFEMDDVRNFATAVAPLGGIRVLVNRGHVVLAASFHAEQLLGIRPGMSLAEYVESAFPLVSPSGRPISRDDWPWTQCLREKRDVPVTAIVRDGLEYSLDCHALTDPIIGSAVMLDLHRPETFAGTACCIAWTDRATPPATLLTA
jgi:hypothetical protein